jgi:hypothetical protein
MLARITLMRSFSGRSMKTPRAHWRGKISSAKALPAHQALGAVFFGADKLGAGSGGFGLGVAGHVELRGEVGNLRTDFAFEAWPAMHE